MILNQLKRDINQLIEEGYGDNRVMLQVDGIKSGLNDIVLYTKQIGGIDEIFVRMSDDDEWEEIE